MKLNLPAVLMILVGTLLIYSAYKKEDPRNVIFESLGIKRRVGTEAAGKAAAETARKLAKPAVNVPSAVPGSPVVTV